MDIYRNTLLSLLTFGDFFELRLIFPKAKVGGLQGELNKDTLEKFIELIQHFDKRCQVEMSLNPLTFPVPSSKGFAKNSNIAYRRYVQVDVDSTSSDALTDEVKSLCHDFISEIKQYLTDAGFCAPLLADSGNSYHLLYHVGNLPNNTCNTNIVRAFLNALKTRFSNDHATIDTMTANAGRLVKIYGTHSVKPPHRQSRILEIPTDWRTAVVTPEQLQSIISQNPTEKTYSEDSFRKMKPKELIKWEVEFVLKLLKECGITVQSIQTLDNGTKKYALVGCPFAKPGTTRQVSCLHVYKDGKMSLSCLHDDCYDYDILSFLLNQINQKIIPKLEE